MLSALLRAARRTPTARRDRDAATYPDVAKRRGAIVISAELCFRLTVSMPVTGAGCRRGVLDPSGQPGPLATSEPHEVLHRVDTFFGDRVMVAVDGDPSQPLPRAGGVGDG